MLDKEDLQAIQLMLEAMEQRTDTKLEAMEQRIDAKLDTMEQRTDTKLETMEQRIDAKFDTMEQRIDAKLDTMEQRTDEKLSTMEQRIMSGASILLETKFQTHFNLLAEGQKAILAKLPDPDELEKMQNELDLHHAMLKKHTQEIQQLKKAN